MRCYTGRMHGLLQRQTAHARSSAATGCVISGYLVWTRQRCGWSRLGRCYRQRGRCSTQGPRHASYTHGYHTRTSERDFMRYCRYRPVSVAALHRGGPDQMPWLKKLQPWLAPWLAPWLTEISINSINIVHKKVCS